MTKQLTTALVTKNQQYSELFYKATGSKSRCMSAGFWRGSKGVRLCILQKDTG